MSSKLAPGCMGGSQEALDMFGLGSWILLVDDFGMATGLAAAGNRIMGRRVVVYEDQGGRVVTVENINHLTPLEAAMLFWRLMLPTVDANPAIKIWTVLNEPVLGDDPAKYDWLSQFSIECMKLFETRGLKAVIFNFSAGNPGDFEMWRHLIPAVRYARDHGHFVGLHEYGGVWMWWMCGSFQKLAREADWSVGPGDEGFTTLRYRHVHRNYFEPAGLGDARLLITECGLDAVGPAPDGFDAGNWRHDAGQWGRWSGWRDPIDYWRGQERDAERYYAEQLIWYDRELRRDPCVEAAFIFTFNHNNPAWGDYDLKGTRVAQHIIDYMRREASVVDPAPALLPLPVPLASTKFKTNDDVEVTSDDGLYARISPSKQSASRQLMPVGATGVVVDGPVNAETLNWWKVAYDNGPVGWSVEDWLELHVAQPPPTPTPTTTGDPMPNANLYPNPTFADGWHHQDNVAELAVPDGSVVTFFDDMRTLPDETVSVRVARVETVVWPVTDAPETERVMFFGPKKADGTYTFLHIFKEFKPWLGAWAGLAADIALAAGDHLYTVELFPKHTKDTGDYVDKPETRSADYLRHAHYRCYAGAQVGPWLDGSGIKCGEWSTLSFPFTVARPATVRVGYEWAALFGLEDNCVFARNPRLVRLGDAGPNPTPAPTPQPGAGAPVNQDMLRAWREEARQIETRANNLSREIADSLDD